MEIAHLLIILMVIATGSFLLCGYPVAFTLAGTALAFALIGIAADVIALRDILAYPDRIFGTMTNDVLLAVPLFVFMGIVLERSKIAEELLEAMERIFRGVRGGLGVSVFIVGALMAASTGIVGATVVTMGLISLPTMLRRGYDPALASGSIAAAGTLGQIIPPSIVLILLGDVLANEYLNVKRELGERAIHSISVGDLFAGALLPGLGLVVLYIAYQIIIAYVRPDLVPPAATGLDSDDSPSMGSFLGMLLPPLALMGGVLGSILGGIATPTEAASVGAVGALLLTGMRLERAEPWPVRAGVLSLVGLLALSWSLDLRLGRTAPPIADQIGVAVSLVLCALLAYGLLVAIRRAYRHGILTPVLRQTAKTTSMVFIILVGASLFSLTFISFGGDDAVRMLLSDLPGGKAGAVLVVMLVMFILGFFLDFIEITFVVVPIVAPALLLMGVDPVWLGVMMAVNLQTSFLTPPFGFALFYLRGVAPDSVTTAQIYRGAIPFVAIQLAALVILFAFPEIATWLPQLIYG